MGCEQHQQSHLAERKMKFRLSRSSTLALAPSVERFVFSLFFLFGVHVGGYMFTEMYVHVCAGIDIFTGYSCICMCMYVENKCQSQESSLRSHHLVF